MRKRGLWGGCAVLLLALGVAAASAAPPPRDDDDDVPKAGPWQRDGWNPALVRLFGGGDTKPVAGKDTAPAKDKKADEPAPRPARAEVAARYRALEEAKLHRRQDVCLRLREIARENQDEELERKAIQLDQLAWEVYQQRTLRLAGETADSEQRPPADPGNAAGVREVKP